MTADNVRMGKRIADARQRKGWSKADLARRSGVAPSYVTRIEQGAFARPSIEQVQAIAAALGCRVSDLTEPEAAPVSSGIRGHLEAMGLDPVEEAQLMAEIVADLATMAPGRERIETLRALATLVRPKPTRQ